MGHPTAAGGDRGDLWWVGGRVNSLKGDLALKRGRRRTCRLALLRRYCRGLGLRTSGLGEVSAGDTPCYSEQFARADKRFQ